MAIGQTDAGDALGLRALFERLDVLSMLEADWDSYGGLPPTARAIGLASRVIVEAVAHAGEPPAAVMPLPDGGLQLIWDHGQDELQVDVGPAGGLGYLAVHLGDGDPVMSEADDLSLTEALALIEKLPR